MGQLRKLTAILLLVAPVAVHATIVPVADRAAFDALAGATTLVDFEAEQTGGAVTFYGGSLTVGGVTFTQGNDRLFVLGPGVYGTSGTSNYLNHNAGGSEPVVIDFAQEVFAIGMDTSWLHNWGESDNPETMTFLLSTGESFAQDIAGPLISSATGMDFVGFYSDQAFTSLTILDSSNSLMIDNFAYGTEAVAAPEPGTLMLFGIGLFGIAAARRRRTITA